MCNLADYYDAASDEEWRAVLGEEMHYHFGYSLPGLTIEQALNRTVENFYPWIAEKASVLIMGCNWGGSARMLERDRLAQIHGVTFSARQAQFCQSLGIKVLGWGLEQTELSQAYDTILGIEIFSHLSDKAGWLQRMRQHTRVGGQLLLSVHCRNKGERLQFGRSMRMVSEDQLLKLVQENGWQVVSVSNRRMASVPTLSYWRKNLRALFGSQRPNGHLGDVWDMAELALGSPQQLVNWCQNHPLLDLVLVNH